MDNLTETKLTSEKIYSGCILDFYRDTVRLPNGGTAPRELSRHVGAVCIVPLLDDGRVIVERQFRYPVNEIITEIPAGKRDSRDEAPEAAACRLSCSAMLSAGGTGPFSHTGRRRSS